MYIVKVRKSNLKSNKAYEYLHLVENVRTEKGPRRRLILNLGRLDIHADQYKELANCIEGLLSGQQELFSPDLGIAKLAHKAVRRIQGKNGEAAPRKTPECSYQQVDVTSIAANESRSIGAEYVCHAVYNDLRINDVFIQSGVSEHVFPLIEALVIGRLISPGSERHTWEWMQNRSAIFELTGDPLRASLNSLYRAGDTLLECKSALERHLSCRERDIFSLGERLCFFDLTNSYFEGQALQNPKAQRGYSKEKRSDCKLQTLALIIDEQGFAKFSRLYPGNQAETKTLAEMLDLLTESRPDLARDRTVIMDAGIASKDNLSYLKAKGFHYIVVERGKADFVPDDVGSMRLIRGDETYKVEVKRHEADGETYLLCRSTGREGKDRGIRGRQEKLFLERLEYFKQGLDKKGHTKRYAKVIETVGRLREKYPKASKVYEVEVVPKNNGGKVVDAEDIRWCRKKAFERESLFDGCYVLRTDRTDLTDTEIWETYTMLTRIERAFRSMKSSLGLRPNFHQKEDRADAHMFISVLAYHILHAIEHRLRQSGDRRCWDTLRQVLSTHQRLTVEYTAREDITGRDHVERRFVRLCTTAEPEHTRIYRGLGLQEAPLGKLHYTRK